MGSTDDFHERLQQRRAEERDKRMLEGGRGGGFNDRQEAKCERSSVVVDESGLDEFGRRVNKKGDQPTSKAARAQAALERLKQRSSGSTPGGAVASSRPQRSRSRSR